MYLPTIDFSLWLDFLERDFLQKEFPKWLDVINGATSNPSIFKEAILSSPAYKAQLRTLQGLDAKERYEALAITDIQKAADLLLPLYEKGDEGFVSIEVDPRLAHDTQGTIQEALHLVEKIDRPNVMIKIPVTPAGCAAIEYLVAQGIHVNATLIFSPYQADACLDAMQSGFKKNQKSHTVLSVFVSRFDRKLDPLLVQKGLEPGRVGIMNAAKIYNLVKKRSLPNTKTLFASTSVKGGAFPPHYYISELVAPHAINTAPLATIRSFLESGDKEAKLPRKQEEIEAFFSTLKAHGIDMKRVYRELLEEGLRAFEQAFEAILEELENVGD